MDLKALLAKAGVPGATAPDQKPKLEIVRTTNESEPINDLTIQATCECGHPENAHSDTGECEILECECGSFFELRAIEGEQISLPVVDSAVAESKGGDEGSSSAAPTTSSVGPIALDTTAEGALLPFTVSELPKPSKNIEDISDDYCHHLCTCDNWWTHGLKDKCRYPDQLSQGKCQACLNGLTDQIKPEDSFVDGKLTIPAQIKVRNDERLICKAMTIDQLTRHIEFHAQRIEELRIRSLEARKMREELEEEELQHIPEHEREAFLQALRLGDQAKTKKPRKVREPKTAKEPKLNTAKAKEAALTTEIQAQGKSLSDAKLIASWMVKTGKTQAQVEAFLND